MDILKVINVLENIKAIMKQLELDVSWSSYTTEDDLFNDIDAYIDKLKHKDLSCLKDIKYLFAPTGDLQEISMNSGFAEKYLEMSEIIDRNIK